MSSVLNTPNPTSITLGPDEILQQLRALRDQVPELTFQSRQRNSVLARQGSVPPQLVQEAIDAVDSSGELRGAIGRSAPELKAEIDVTAGWASVVAELRSMLGSASATVLTRRQRTGVTALQALQISRQLVRQEEHAHLRTNIAAMERHLARKRIKPAETQPAPPQLVKPQ